MSVLEKYSVLLVAVIMMMFAPLHGQATEVGSVTGLPLPRFVTLKASETNLRKGPNVSFPIVWTYKHKGYPMQLVAEFENWRKLRDHDGAEGWVHENLITGVRNVAIIANNYKTKNKMYMDRTAELIIFRYPSEISYPMARLQFGTIAVLKQCRTEWCKIKIGYTSGWARKVNLWGVNADEMLR